LKREELEEIKLDRCKLRQYLGKRGMEEEEGGRWGVEGIIITISSIWILTSCLPELQSRSPENRQMITDKYLTFNALSTSQRACTGEAVCGNDQFHETAHSCLPLLTNKSTKDRKV